MMEGTLDISEIIIINEHTGLLQIPTFQALTLSYAMA